MGIGGRPELRQLLQQCHVSNATSAMSHRQSHVSNATTHRSHSDNSFPQPCEGASATADIPTPFSTSVPAGASKAVIGFKTADSALPAGTSPTANDLLPGGGSRAGWRFDVTGVFKAVGCAKAAGAAESEVLEDGFDSEHAEERLCRCGQSDPL